MGVESELDVDALIGGSFESDSVSAADLGDFVGLSVRTVRELSERGVIQRCGPNRFRLRDSVRAYCASLRETASGRSKNANLTAEKLRYETARADAQELKNAAMRGQLVPVGEVERAWSAILRDVRAAMLAIPARIQQQVGTLTAQDVDTIDREIRNALEETANGK